MQDKFFSWNWALKYVRLC